MSIPLRATYRIQFHKNYTLYDAALLVPYLARLGISHIYASPLLAAMPGSMHGYDTISWDCIDPERGGEAGLIALVTALRAHNMGLILDIVPNHMAASHQNLWWQDVLLYGKNSQYADFFDIDWSISGTGKTQRIILPFLEKPLSNILEEQKIHFSYQDETRCFVFVYENRFFPVVLESVVQVSGLPDCKKAEDLTPHARKFLAGFFSSETLAGRQHLLTLLHKQHYQLVWWQTTGDLVNWRRFFDVASLVALRMERSDVFDRTHTYVFDLYQRGLIDGLRIDHIDGLLQPAEYCQKLQRNLEKLTPKRPGILRSKPLVFVEKILANKEYLPKDWPVNGTTGYDFLEQASLLLHNPQGEEELNNLWKQHGPFPYKKVQETARNEKLHSSFYKMFQDLVLALAAFFPSEQDVTAHSVAHVLRKILCAFPVYRIYFCENQISKQSAPYLHAACKEAQKTLPAYYIPLLKNLEHLLSQNIFPTSDSKEPANLFMCLTAPLAAKAGEDTAFYRYARLLSRNEVGTDPELFSKDIETFHQTNMERFASYPDALLCTATHDHKRGEDGRARLMVLSEPEVNWPDTAMHWCEKNDTLCTDGNSISRMDELFIYQTLIAAWPLDRSDFSHLLQRLKGYLTKALREASLRTSWNAPDRVYEETCQSFMMQLLHTPFVQEFTAFIGRISPAAALNSLAQLILRYTVPGVPDLYQGRENWDFSLVDPDNRRPVNYPKLQESLDEKANLFVLAHSWQDGRIKQVLISKLLALRKNHPQIFTNGYYEPVSIQGPLADHVVAFQRITKDIKIFVIVTRFPFSLSINNYLQSHHEGWMKTEISLPASQLNRAWKSVLWERPLENIASFCLAYFYRSIPFDVLITHNTDGVS